MTSPAEKKANDIYHDDYSICNGFQEALSALPYSLQVSAISPKMEEIKEDWPKIISTAKQRYNAETSPEFDVSNQIKCEHEHESPDDELPLLIAVRRN